MTKKILLFAVVPFVLAGCDHKSPAESMGLIAPLNSQAQSASSSSAASAGSSSSASSSSSSSTSAAPVISSVGSSNVRWNSAIITWTTDKPADSQVDFGQTTSYERKSDLDSASVTSHRVTLSNLASSTDYHYRVRSRDAAGNLSVSTDHSFKTLPPPPAQCPPVALGCDPIPTGCHLESGMHFDDQGCAVCPSVICP